LISVIEILGSSWRSSGLLSRLQGVASIVNTGAA
jgi:hypothetical protein